MALTATVRDVSRQSDDLINVNVQYTGDGLDIIKTIHFGKNATDETIRAEIQRVGNALQSISTVESTARALIGTPIAIVAPPPESPT